MKPQPTTVDELFDGARQVRQQLQDLRQEVEALNGVGDVPRIYHQVEETIDETQRLIVYTDIGDRFGRDLAIARSHLDAAVQAEGTIEGVRVRCMLAISFVSHVLGLAFESDRSA